MKLRILKIGLDKALELFISKWKFYTVSDLIIQIEVPRGQSESFIVRIQASSEQDLLEKTKVLANNDFIPQEIKYIAG